jgi:hypothetical protein
MAYKLEFPPSSRVHLVFHVYCLKKVIGDKISIQNILPKINEEGKIILELETIIETRINSGVKSSNYSSTSSNGRTY